MSIGEKGRIFVTRFFFRRPQNLRPGIKVTLSTLLEGKNFNAGGHKVGVGLDFES